MIIRFWRMLFPKWERRWCIVASAVNPDWKWIPDQCWYRNGEVDIRYDFLFVLPVKDEDEAKEIARKFNEITERYDTRLTTITTTPGDQR